MKRDIAIASRSGAHATGVRSFVAVEDALVILRADKRDHMLAIAEREEAGFLAFHELLDDDLMPAIAEGALEHGVDGAGGLGA